MTMRLVISLQCSVIAIFCGACAIREPPEIVVTPEVLADAGTVTISSSCGGYMNPPQFAGHVMGRLADGSVVPLPDVSFFRVTSHDDPKKRQLHPTQISTDARGYFDTSVGIATSWTIWSEGSKTLEQGGKFLKSESWVEDVVFELRASGCDSLVVRFSMEWQPHSLELSCIARAERARHDS